MMQFEPGSYLFSQFEEAQEQAGAIFSLSPRELLTFPDFYLLQGASRTSIGIQEIREIISIVRMTPLIAPYKIITINDMHLATPEAQNALLKILEEPPLYAYLFLVTPFADRLLKTIISRVQTVEKSKIKSQKLKLQIKSQKLNELLTMNHGQRLLWLEAEVGAIKDKTQLKQQLMTLVDQLLNEARGLLNERKLSPNSIEYLKECKYNIEQGFPLPKLLVEGFLLTL